MLWQVPKKIHQLLPTIAEGGMFFEYPKITFRINMLNYCSSAAILLATSIKLFLAILYAYVFSIRIYELLFSRANKIRVRLVTYR